MLYNNSAFGAPYKTVKRMGTNTEPNYLFGSFESDQQPFEYTVTNVALTSNVATITVAVKSGGGPGFGALPQVGAKMGVKGTTAASGAFNVDPATVTATTVDATTGTGTISYAVTHANVTSAADVGIAIVQPYETGDIVAAGSASAPIALIFTPDEDDNSRCLFCEARWSGTVPSAASVVLQVANVDDDARYYTLQNAQGVFNGTPIAASGALATITGSAVVQAGAQYSFVMGKFIRAKVVSATGADSTTGLVVTVFG